MGSYVPWLIETYIRDSFDTRAWDGLSSVIGWGTVFGPLAQPSARTEAGVANGIDATACCTTQQLAGARTVSHQSGIGPGIGLTSVRFVHLKAAFGGLCQCPQLMTLGSAAVTDSHPSLALGQVVAAQPAI